MRLKLKPNPPHAYVDFFNATDTERRKKIEEGFYHRADISAYIDTMDGLENERVANIEHLEEIQSVLGPDDGDYLQMVEAKVQELKSGKYYEYGQGPIHGMQRQVRGSGRKEAARADWDEPNQSQ